MELLNAIGFFRFKITDMIDILLVAIILFELYRWLRGTAAIRIFWGIMIVFVVWKMGSLFQLNMFTEIIGQFISVGMILLIVVFQPELRKFLLYIGNTRFLKWFQGQLAKKYQFDDYNNEIEAIVGACKSMSASKTGALIILARQTPLNDYLNTGEQLDALVSRELLENIFFKNSPLHDGAVIIKKHRISAARCILPISKIADLPSDLGLRHRSAIGSTILTDAIAIIVSEQTGDISLCKEGDIQRDISPTILKQLLIEMMTVEKK